MSDGASADPTQEFVLRAPGPEHSFTKYFMGMFPGGDPGFAKKKHADFQLEREPETDTSRSMMEASRVHPWRLLDGEGCVSHRGLPEGGLAGASSSAGYFVLIKEGDNFTAIPIDDFYSFRPTQKFKVNSLEEAERQMDGRNRVVFPAATSRLAALVAQAEERGGAEPDDVASGSDREDEDEEDFMLGGRRGGVSGGLGKNGQSKGETDEGMDVAVDRAKKGEDWEHEDERPDDDVDMGEEGEDADATPTPPKGVRVGSDSDDDGRSAPGLSIQSKLRDTGLESDSGDEDDEDDDLDDDDLDAPLAPYNRAGTADGQGDRRKSPTPSSMPGPSSSQQPAMDARPAKRKAEDAAADGIKKAKHVEAATPPSAADSGGGVTEQEIVEFLTASGPIASSALTARFKRQIKRPEHKTGFTKLVKKVAKLEEVPPGSGNRCIVLKG